MHTNHKISVGFETLQQIDSETHHAHSEYVITLMLEGELLFEQEHRISIAPGMLTLVPSGAPHALHNGKNMKLWWVSFCPACLDLNERHLLMQTFANIRLGGQASFQLPAKRLEHTIRLFEELQAELAAPHSACDEVSKSLLLLILNEAHKQATLPSEHQGIDTQVARALNYIQQHALTPISAKDVASALNLSPAYLATRVKAKTGFTLSEWLTRSRLNQACFLLQHTDEKVEQIALKVGWQDVTHFIRQFKKHYGHTPAAWRRAQS